MRPAGRRLGRLEPGDRPFFPTLADDYDAAAERRCADAAELATRATGRTRRWGATSWRSTHPRADRHDPVGRERYALYARDFNGIELDLDETYAWGWEELHRIEHAMREVAERIIPGAPIDEVIEHLEADPTPAIEGVDEFQRWNQELLDTTIAELERHPLRHPRRRAAVEAMIAPPGGAAAMYYTGPTEDFSRPGRTWYPTLGKTRFPLWGEVSICYHEGVPGHHLQIAQVRVPRRHAVPLPAHARGSSGHGEGWALYAERLMGELGYLDDPAYELGMLAAQAMRAVRVVVDIGMHLELPIPAGERYHPGETWTPELALPFVIERSAVPRRLHAQRGRPLPRLARARRSATRSASGSGSAPCRRASSARAPAFDLKEFHRRARPRPHGSRAAARRARPVLTRV